MNILTAESVSFLGLLMFWVMLSVCVFFRWTDTASALTLRLISGMAVAGLMYLFAL